DADGKPISISLKPIATSLSNSSSFCSTDIGATSAWLPSRRSTLHQSGADSITRSGHVLSRSTSGRYALYLRGSNARWSSGQDDPLPLLSAARPFVVSSVALIFPPG